MVVFTNKLVLLPSIPGDKVRHSWQSLSTIKDVFWWILNILGCGCVVGYGSFWVVNCGLFWVIVGFGWFCFLVITLSKHIALL